MAQDQMRFDFIATSIADANTAVQGFIDDFWSSIDAAYTPTSIKIFSMLKFNVKNASNAEKAFDFRMSWEEDAAVQNTRMKNIWAAFTAGLTAMEGQSSYTSVLGLKGTVYLKVTYS